MTQLVHMSSMTEMTVLDLRAHFKILRGNEGSPKRKSNDLPQENVPSPAKKVKKHTQFLGREGGGS